MDRTLSKPVIVRQRKKIDIAIKKFICETKLPPGAKLPPERELAEMFNVQRLTIRRAVEKLCQAGVLEKRPRIGAFVKISQVEEHSRATDPIIYSTGQEQIFYTSKTTEIVFAADDKLPSQIENWETIFRIFEKKHPGIKVKYQYRNFLSPSNSEPYDCGLVYSGGLSEVLKQPIKHFSKKLFDLPSDGFPLNPNLMNRIIQMGIEDNGLVAAVPLFLSFPLICYNKSTFAKHSLSPLPSGAPWQEYEKWLNKNVKKFKGLGYIPYVNSCLNHLGRVNREIFSHNTINLKCKEIHEFVKHLKDIYNLNAKHLELSNPALMEELFMQNKIIATEVFINKLYLAQRRFGADNLGTAYGHHSRNGIIQLLPQYLVLKCPPEKFTATMEFFFFLIEKETQLLLADMGFGIPFYWSSEGTKIMCERFSVDYLQTVEYLKQAEDFYSNPFFNIDSNALLLPRVLNEYFLGNASFEQIAENVKKRFARLFQIYSD